MGIGLILIQHAAAEARILKVKVRYLFTPIQEALYKRLGWGRIEHAEYQGHKIAIMACALAA